MRGGQHAEAQGLPLPPAEHRFPVHHPPRQQGRGDETDRARERYADRRPADRRADAGFVEALWLYFGDTPFERGNLDAGRLSWLFGREVIPAEDPFDPESYEALLMLDVDRARAAFPEAFDGSGIWEGRAP
jgi:hypothetical protein